MSNVTELPARPDAPLRVVGPGEYYRHCWQVAVGAMNKPLAEVTPTEVIAFGVLFGTAVLVGRFAGTFLALAARGARRG